MDSTFILNLIHRPELSPEYSSKVTSGSKAEDISRSSLTDESLEIFKLQQSLAHQAGLKTTIEMTYSSLFSDEAVALAKADHEQYGDEIALSLLGLPCKEFRDEYQTKDFCIWMFDKPTKRKIIDEVFNLFHEKFYFYPESTGSYYIDAYSLRYIKKKYPSVVAAVATCFEEGPKAYHTCNNSWYTFLDGGPWAPWIPSKKNTHCPASSKSDDVGIVCIPHLSRDVMACFDGNGSNFGTHPQNVLRGMIYRDNEYPYLYNLIDEYRHQANYNNGLAYNMMFVGPGWMNKAGRWEAPYSLLKKSYTDAMNYYGSLKKAGKLVDMTMSEFAHYYREKKTYQEPEIALWKDILYGSNKQYCWYIDPSFRTCLDFNQGGAMIDMRPYVAKLPWGVGIGERSVYDASYPYLIQANYRAGYFTHYAGEGTVKSFKVSHNGEIIDGCLCRTMASYSRVGKDTLITANPVSFVFADGLTVEVKSSFLFKKGKGQIEIKREILNDLKGQDVEIEEYFTGAYGTTEYQADLSEVILTAENKKTKKSLQFAYRCREINLVDIENVSALVPYVNTKIIMSTNDKDAKGRVNEGYAFSPVYRLAIQKHFVTKGALTTCLSLKKGN